MWTPAVRLLGQLLKDGCWEVRQGRAVVIEATQTDAFGGTLGLGPTTPTREK